MIKLNCVCQEIDGIPCDSVLELDTLGDSSVRGVQITENGVTASMLISESLAVIIEKAILEYNGDK